MKELNSYFALFHGEKVTDSDIKTHATFALKEFDTLLRGGRIVGQGTLDGDIIWWMPAKIKEVENGS